MTNHRGRPPGAGAHRYLLSLRSICGRLVLLLGANVELLTASPPAAAKLIFCAIAKGLVWCRGLCNAWPPTPRRASASGPLAQGIGSFAQFAPYYYIPIARNLSTVSFVTPPTPQGEHPPPFPPQGGGYFSPSIPPRAQGFSSPFLSEKKSPRSGKGA